MPASSYHITHLASEQITGFAGRSCLLLLLLGFSALPDITFGQDFFRIKSDFSIKEISANGKSQLIMGQVYYDINSEKIVYKIRFPENEIWVISDSVFYQVIDNIVTEKQDIPAVREATIFHLSLEGKLDDYGLTGSFYKISKVEKEDDLVITTWIPEKYKKKFGKIVLSQKDKKLNGIVLFNPKDEIISKQIFRNYVNLNGMEFPGEVIQITYTKDGENHKITTYTNIIVNSLTEDDIYNYTIPH